MATLDHIITGSFTADGNNHIISLPCGVDFMEVENLTQIITPINATGVKFRWQAGFAAASAIQETVSGAGVLSIGQITTNGFTFLNTSDPQVPGPLLSGSAISGATPPIVTSANTGTLGNGDIVEIINWTGAHEFDGYQFSVDTVTANTSFRLPFAPTIVATASSGNYRVIKFQPNYYPRRLFITSISLATSAVVVFTVTHNLTVGQRIVFGTIPSSYGMTQISGLRGLITAINTTTNSVTVNIDTSGFTAFAFPTTANAVAAHTLPSAVPFGDGPATLANPLGNQSVLDGATRNTAVRGMLLGSGANGPAGQNNDVIFWRAFKAEQVQTTFFA
jgi:hypothetical protein